MKSEYALCIALFLLIITCASLMHKLSTTPECAPDNIIKPKVITITEKCDCTPTYIYMEQEPTVITEYKILRRCE